MAAAEHAVEIFIEQKFRAQMARHIVEPAQGKVDLVGLDQIERLLTVGGPHMQVEIGRLPPQPVEQRRYDGQSQPVGHADPADPGCMRGIESRGLEQGIADQRHGFAQRLAQRFGARREHQPAGAAHK